MNVEAVELMMKFQGDTSFQSGHRYRSIIGQLKVIGIATYLKRFCTTIVGLLLCSGPIHAEDISSRISYNLNSNSLSTAEQTRVLYQFLKTEMASDRSQGASLIKINEKLELMELPMVDLGDSNLKVVVAVSNSFMPRQDNVVGASIEDGTHLFCLPCKQGHNNFVFGILNKNDSRNLSFIGN